MLVDLQPGRGLRRRRHASTAASRRSRGCSSSVPASRPEALTPHLYVHYDDRAVSHLFTVAAGLDSMVVGEGQILGQVRDALRLGQELGTVGPALNELFQQALRVGKRAHAETDIDRAGPSLVTVGSSAIPGRVAGRRVVVVGAGSMASLAAATVHRMGASDLVVANRTPERAERLATEYAAAAGVAARPRRRARRADVVVSCTGAAGVAASAAPPSRRPGRTRVGARWPWSTSRCPTTSTRPPPSCPV